jgi:hypothetical protein
MDNEYTSEQKLIDAVQFATSRFGLHYLGRLRSAYDRCMTDVLNVALTDSYRANRASQAQAIQAELDYFTTAEATVRNPSLMERLRAAVTKKKEAETPDIDL